MEETTADQLIDGALATFLSLFTWLCIQLMGLIERRTKKLRLLWDSSSKMDLMGYNGEDEDIRCSRTYDLYLNFLWIFAGIYALSKLTQLLELYLGQRLIPQKGCCDVRTMSCEWEQTLMLYETDKRQLEAQVQSWREKNLNLEQTIKELRESNIHFLSENLMRTVMQEQKTSPAPSNIYISNSHFHLTRQIFVNEGQKGGNHRNVGGDDLYETEATQESLNVWMQYLKMRKCYMGPIADPTLTAVNSAEELLPIVMTTEQLAKLQGMI
ncbi:uncharacterized protein [Drosophila kikkawai]|uniref:Uncharacterized protein n=1 Tax=Drosophila kikkawai TaxID=30033 RepID=A0A6P4J6H5_DROKI